MFRRSAEKMHHLDDGKNDWDGLADHELNRHQRIAKKTRGILTLANGITITGGFLVMNGISDFVAGNKTAGLIKIGAGRVADIGDGNVADMTGTKGKVGKVLDPTVDMAELAVALPFLVQNTALPVAAAVAVGMPKALNTIGSVAAFARKRPIDAANEGKIGTTAIWTGLSSFVLRAALDKHAPGVVDTTLDAVGWGGMVGGSAWQLPATYEYLSAGLGTAVNTEQPDTSLALETE